MKERETRGKEPEEAKRKGGLGEKKGLKTEYLSRIAKNALLATI